ncbi:fasciclin domain-containing protein [Botryobacter ruber]|uniref:fasciclin domain-containing protein n=1 Tax=Botryobacter ruber TaxID=2171629 RepID=UPI0013E3B9B7|nr:fasciclin domain-containing protein [Botryobacter ruber]
MGNFKNFLACVDKAGYKHTLSSSGYWTIFAPTDEAFQQFFATSGLAGIEAIDAAKAREIVTYALIYNAFNKERLSDYQSNIGWVEDESFRRRTAYYTGSYTADVAGKNEQVVASNRNGGSYVPEDNNNKYITYFTSDYFAAHGLSEADYTTFFPGVPFTGFNVVDAAVVDNKHSIRAENGMIHVVNKVILPLPSIDQYLSGKPEYAEFRKLLEKYGAVYTHSPIATEKWNKIKGTTDPVYLKTFAPALAFNPGNENFLKQTDNDGQFDAWSMFVPTNQALTAYINEVLLEHYESLDEMDPQIIYDFLNAHMWQTAVWPTKFNATANFVGEPARFNRATDIIDPKILSNGMFYGANKVQRSDAFHSVFGKVYLDPKYSMMSRFLQRELRNAVSNPNVRFTMFLLSDEALTEAGYSFNIQENSWYYNGSTNQAVNRLDRLINSQIAVTLRGELDNLGGEGIIDTYGGELIKFKNNMVYAAGNLEPDPQAALTGENLPRITAKKETSNGVVYYIDKPLLFPEQAIGLHMKHYPQFSKYFSYLENSPLYNKTTGEINGIANGAFYTYFIPSNAAMDQAVADGVLPADPTSTNVADREMIDGFLIYHILNRFAIIPNGKEEGRLESVFKTLIGDVTTITVDNEPNQLKLTDMKGRTANVVVANSNKIANRSVMHQIDNYLQYVQ